VQAIRFLAADPDRRRQMGISGRQYIVRRLSREQTARTYIEVLQKLQG